MKSILLGVFFSLQNGDCFTISDVFASDTAVPTKRFSAFRYWVALYPLAMCKMNNSQEGTFTCPSGNLFICTLRKNTNISPTLKPENQGTLSSQNHLRLITYLQHFQTQNRRYTVRHKEQEQQRIINIRFPKRKTG